MQVEGIIGLSVGAVVVVAFAFGGFTTFFCGDLHRYSFKRDRRDAKAWFIGLCSGEEWPKD